MLAYIAGIYLLAGAIGSHLMDYLARDEYVLSEFGIMPAVAIVVAVIMALEVVRMQRKINRHIDRIGETP